MANKKHLAILREGVDTWNMWRDENPDVQPDLSGADLSGSDFSDADLSGTNFQGADFSNAIFREADLTGIDFKSIDNFDGADFREAYLCDVNFFGFDLNGFDFFETDFRGADLRETDLSRTNLTQADLRNADLRGANLIGALLVNTKVDGAKVSGSFVYSSSVWGLVGEFEEQSDLVITPMYDPVITVDNIKVAQFIYLILNNAEIRGVIDALTSKSVLILGRFTPPERKAILNQLREKLREYDLLPIVFDFERPKGQDFTETIKTLAGMCYFVIADITNPKSSPLELQATIPDYQIPFVPIIQSGERPFSMMANLQSKYNWVLDTLEYESGDVLIEVLKNAVIDPAIEKHNQLQLVKAQQPKIRYASDFLRSSSS